MKRALVLLALLAGCGDEQSVDYMQCESIIEDANGNILCGSGAIIEDSDFDTDIANGEAQE